MIPLEIENIACFEVENKAQKNGEFMVIKLNLGDTFKALDYAYDMLLALSEDNLTVDLYDSAYCLIIDKLLILNQTLKSETNDSLISEMYNYVQMKYKAVARCYLMIVIGTVILSRDSNLFENITKDLSMACISVQSPLKGLYLRKFLTDSILSIHISDQLALHSTFFDFLLTNFSSINRLWIKTRFYVGELEAYDEIHFRLKFFIHSCLNRISDSINTDGEMYGSVVLPKILDEIICCKDIKSQEILLSLILISFHFKLNISNIKLILNRIKDITTGYNYFIFVSKFCDAMERYFILEEENIKHPETEIKKLFTHVHDYARFCPNPLDKNIFVAYNGIFKIAATLLIRDEKFIAEIVHACYEFFCASVVEEIEEETRVFIRMLCSTKISLKFILSLDCLYSFLDGLNPIDKNQYLSQIGQTSCVNHVFVTQNEVDKFFDFLNYMLQTETLAIDACKKSSKYFKNNVIKCYDFLPVLFLSVEFEHISLLNENSLKFISIILKTPQKYHHLIIPSLINQILKNIIKFNTVTVSDTECIENLLLNCFKMISYISKTNANIMIQNYLLCASVSDLFVIPDCSRFTGSFISESFTLFEECITSKDQLQCLDVFINCLYSLNNIEGKLFSQYCSQLEKNARVFKNLTNQCHGFLKIAHIYWLGTRDSSKHPLIQDEPDSIYRCLTNAFKCISLCLKETARLSNYSQLIMKSIYFIEENCQIDFDFIPAINTKALEDETNVRSQPGDNQLVLENFSRAMDRYREVVTKLKTPTL